MATAKLYLNTGFSAVNLPYDKASLVAAAAQTLDIPALDLIQIFELTSVRVKAFEHQIMDADYLELSSVQGETTYTSFYVVSGYQMTSMDVAVLDIVPDPVLTCGGVEKITPITGTFSRYGGQRTSAGVDKTTMLLDEMMVPSIRAKYKYKAIGDFTQHLPSNGHFIVASTADLTKVPEGADNETVAYKYDETTGELKYSFVPQPAVGTSIYINFPAEMGGGMVTTMTPGYGLFDYNDPRIEQAVQTLRAYGYESSIIGVYRVPYEYMEAAGSGMGDGHTFINTDGFYVGIACTATTWNPGFGLANLYDDAKLKIAAELLPYSEQFQIGLISTATGAKIQRRMPDVTGNVIVFADPRPDGGPVFILQNRPVPENATDAELAAYRVSQIQSCSIQGAAWDEVPIIYTGASGAQKNYMRLTMSEQIAQANTDLALANNQARGVMGLLGAGSRAMVGAVNPANMAYTPGHMWDMTQLNAGGYAGVLADITHSNVTPYGAASIGSGGGGMIGSIYSTMANDEAIKNKRLQSSKRNMQEYAIDNRLVSPEMSGQMVEGIQQYLGNGCVAYVIYPDEKDLTKYASIAAAFGLAVDEFAHQITMESGDAIYVRGNGITVLSGPIPVPNGVRDDVGNLLAVGARFWKTRPKQLGLNAYVGGDTT